MIQTRRIARALGDLGGSEAESQAMRFLEAMMDVATPSDVRPRLAAVKLPG